MTRIFSSLAILAILLLAINAVIGLSLGDYNHAFDKTREGLAPLTEELGKLRPKSAEDKAKIEQIAEKIQQVLGEYEPLKKRFTLHFLFGTIASIIVLLVNCISITYFVGTSRWCKEVVETYQLDVNLAKNSTRLKHRTFPWALGAMLVMVGIIALGGAANPGTIQPGTAFWVIPHYAGALLGTALIGYAFLVQWNNINANYQLIQLVVAEVQRIRTERGLDD